MNNIEKKLKERFGNTISNLDYILDCYKEPHRYYHGLIHLEKLLDFWWDQHYNNFFENTWNVSKYDFLYAILYHDIFYNPRKYENEENSIIRFNMYCNDNRINKEKVREAILATKEPWNINKFEGLSKLMVWTDTKELQDFETSVKNENLIFKEYQFVDYDLYKTKRIEILSKIPNVNKEYLTYLKNKERNIGIYAGSFDPFHVGHRNIFEKAERIFDKVVLARGINHKKGNKSFGIPEEYFSYRQVDYYNGLLTDYLNYKNYNLTLIRGLRNTTDLQVEIDMQRYLKELKPDINVISIICDSEFEHISSSSIKGLLDFNKGQNYIVK